MQKKLYIICHDSLTENWLMLFITLLANQKSVGLRWIQLSRNENELTLHSFAEDGSEAADIHDHQWPALVYDVESKACSILEKENTEKNTPWILYPLRHHEGGAAPMLTAGQTFQKQANTEQWGRQIARKAMNIPTYQPNAILQKAAQALELYSVFNQLLSPEKINTLEETANRLNAQDINEIVWHRVPIRQLTIIIPRLKPEEYASKIVAGLNTQDKDGYTVWHRCPAEELYAVLQLLKPEKNAAAIIRGFNTQDKHGHTVWLNFSAASLATIIPLLKPEENAAAIIAGLKSTQSKRILALLDYLLEHENDYPRFTLALISECQLSLNSTQRSLLHRKFTTKQAIASDVDFLIEIKDIEYALHVHEEIRSHEFFPRYRPSENLLIKTLRSLVNQARTESSTPISTSWRSIAALPDFEKFKNSTCINLLQKIGESRHTTISCLG